MGLEQKPYKLGFIISIRHVSFVHKIKNKKNNKKKRKKTVHLADTVTYSPAA